MIKLSPNAQVAIQDYRGEQRFNRVLHDILDCYSGVYPARDKKHPILGDFLYRNCGEQYAFIFKKDPATGHMEVHRIMRKARLHKILNEKLPFN